MQTGTIAKKTDKFFGFIAVEGQEKDLFFHGNDVEDIDFDDLNEGDAVQFEMADGPKGPSAVKVSKVDGGSETTEEEM